MNGVDFIRPLYECSGTFKYIVEINKHIQIVMWLIKLHLNLKTIYWNNFQRSGIVHNAFVVIFADVNACLTHLYPVPDPLVRFGFFNQEYLRSHARLFWPTYKYVYSFTCPTNNVLLPHPLGWICNCSLLKSILITLCRNSRKDFIFQRHAHATGNKGRYEE